MPPLPNAQSPAKKTPKLKWTPIPSLKKSLREVVLSWEAHRKKGIPTSP